MLPSWPVAMASTAAAPAAASSVVSVSMSLISGAFHDGNVLDLASGDPADDLVVAGGLRIELRHHRAEVEHVDVVGHLEDVGQVVADDEHGRARLREPADQGQHLGRLGDAEGGGGTCC